MHGVTNLTAVRAGLRNILASRKIKLARRVNAMKIERRGDCCPRNTGMWGFILQNLYIFGNSERSLGGGGRYAAEV